MPDHGPGDVRELDQRALAATGAVVAAVTPADLDRPTPCTRWRLSDLLEHVVNENRGYGAGLMGAPAILSIWNSGDLLPDPYRAYQRSVHMVETAFATPDAYDGQFEVREFGYFPAPVAIGMHFVEVLVHGWDVAATIGVPYHPDDDLASSALAIAANWSTEAKRRREFAARVRVPAAASDFERLLGLLGRSPSWTPA